ncbi:MBL fold metallo-hydrolase [Thermoanaerobacterium butyriciformans]|uniref:Glyoxylase-like metal-dependent hydrolase (Beta-lactamase superfamily II) n=1 Tax=Thermoanaerobacterium butyriciformans TaxID=1702242 RepID=A0ABS4NI96_9THEO|nr:MBL fold metallo-hydrolase [Thermoanaerobacterium butyriciformans]MBP2073392.1 glyoxylase-like metal-dependent hydrolase (beta-lactamase superfamily II) [Thermoanaerobacterium butyriciformans]
MNLNKINRNTYYIDNPTNIGVYTYKNKNCLLVDTGINNGQARKIDNVLVENGLHPKYIINTHNHMDHCGGNIYFKTQYPGCEIYTSNKERLYIENPELRDYILFSSSSFKSHGESKKSYKVDYVLEYGTNKIGDEKIDIVPIMGHSVEQVGVLTPDRVCFLGDSVFSEKIIGKYSLPYLFNIENSINTLNKIKEIDADFFVLSHADTVLNKEEILKLIDLNLSNINKNIEMIIEILGEPQTRETLLQNIVILNDLPINFNQYYIYFSSISAFISYLYDRDLISHFIENGKLYFYSK